MKTNKNVMIGWLIVLYWLCLPAMGNETDKTVSFYIDNDNVFGEDRCFTGGLRLSWVAAELKSFNKCPWLKWIPISKNPGTKHYLSFSLGLSAYTPDDISKSELIVDDRPYAGYLYFAAAFHSINQNGCDSFEVNLGLVGPHSYADKIQPFIHKIVGGVDPQGWNNQLKDELILQLFYEKSWKVQPFQMKGNFNVEVLPRLGAGLGNAIISGNLGGLLRFGWNIPKDFGMPMKRPGGLKGPMLGKKAPLGIYGIICADLFLNVRNIFLDGNTFVKSHSVDKYFLFGDLTVGVAVQISGFHLSYTYTFWTKRFEIESMAQRFASLTIAYTY